MIQKGDDATDDGRGVEVYVSAFLHSHDQAGRRKGNRRGGKQGVFVDSSPEVVGGGRGGHSVSDLADLLDGR